jgi:hypothetical protein
MKVFTTVGSVGDDGSLTHIDTIEHAGHFWLVTQWLEVPAAGYKTPARIVRLTDLAHQRFPEGSAYGDFVLSQPIAKALFDPESGTQPVAGYVVIERPDIRFPIPRGIH